MKRFAAISIVGFLAALSFTCESGLTETVQMVPDPGIADTLRVTSNCDYPIPEMFEVDVKCWIDREVTSFIVPLQWSDSNVTFDSVSYWHSPVANWFNKTVIVDEASRRIRLEINSLFENPVEPGLYHLFWLYFSADTELTDVSVFIDSTNILGHELTFFTLLGQSYNPQFVPGTNIFTNLDTDLDGVGDQCDTGWTNAGSNVIIDITDSLWLVFDSVTKSGYTDVRFTNNGPLPQDGYNLITIPTESYIDISSGAEYTGSVRLYRRYDENSLSFSEKSLQFLQWNEAIGQWNDITSAVDFENNIICGETDTLTVFAMGRLFQDGDANGDGRLNIADVGRIILYILASGPAPDPLLSGDADGNGKVDIADASFLLNIIFAP